MDLNFETCTPIANGCNGVVCKINVDVDEFKERTCTNCSMDELAIKMVFNYRGSDQDTIAQKKKFDKEYIFPLAHPHWSHVQLFNYFRGRRVDSLLVGKDLTLFEDTTTYFTMELCRTNLKKYIQENKNNISVSSALLMIYQILDGIKHLYDHEVVHLDLKDDNIFIANRRKIKGNQVVIGDFGTIHPFIYKKQVPSNLANRSPELTNFKENHPVDIRKNDVWATGCILFQLLEEGKHPFCDSVNTKFNICTAGLPLSNFDKHGEATKQFLELLWNRDPNKRLDPKIALGICGFLLWGAPTYKYSENFEIFSPEELQSIDGFEKFCSACIKYRESDLQMWLKHRIDEVYTTCIQTQDDDNFDIDFMVHIRFLTSFSPSELLSCMKVLSSSFTQYSKKSTVDSSAKSTISKGQAVSIKPGVPFNERIGKILGFKKCPSCSILAEKSNGCNHISCYNCNCHYCWKCLAIKSIVRECGDSCNRGTDCDYIYHHMENCQRDKQ